MGTEIGAFNDAGAEYRLEAVADDGEDDVVQILLEVFKVGGVKDDDVAAGLFDAEAEGRAAAF